MSGVQPQVWPQTHLHVGKCWRISETQSRVHKQIDHHSVCKRPQEGQSCLLEEDEELRQFTEQRSSPTEGQCMFLLFHQILSGPSLSDQNRTEQNRLLSSYAGPHGSGVWIQQVLGVKKKSVDVLESVLSEQKKSDTESNLCKQFLTAASHTHTHRNTLKGLMCKKSRHSGSVVGSVFIPKLQYLTRWHSFPTKWPLTNKWWYMKHVTDGMEDGHQPRSAVLPEVCLLMLGL